MIVFLIKMGIQSKTIIITRKASDLSISIYPPINLNHNRHHEIALVGRTTYNSIPNITNKNNHFRIIYKNEVKDTELPIGSNKISAINEYIQKEI